MMLMIRKKHMIKFQMRASLKSTLILNSVLIRMKYMIQLQDIIDLN